MKYANRELNKYIPAHGRTEKFILFLAYLGIKEQIGDGSVLEYFLEYKIDPDEWRNIASEILSIPFDLSELEDRDVVLLRQFETFITI